MSLYDKALTAPSAGDITAALVAAGGVSERLIEAYRSILKDRDIDGSTAAITLALPGQSELVQNIHEADPAVVHKVRSFVRKTIGQQLMPELLQVCPSPLPVLDLPSHACSREDGAASHEPGLR